MEDSSMMDKVKLLLRKINLKKVLIALSMIVVLGIASYYIYQDGFSYQIKMDGEDLAYIKEAETLDLSLEQLKDQLKDQYGEKTYFDHKIEVERVRDHSKDDLINSEQLLEKLRNQVKLFKPGYIIKVDGIEMAILDTEEEANLLLDQLLEPYKKEDEEKDFEVLSVSFKQDVQVTEKDVALDKIQSSEEAAEILSEISEDFEEYELKENENTWTVSRSLNVREADILAANPDVVPTRTRAGDKLRIPTSKALLEIVSIERHAIEEEIDYETEEKEDSSLYKDEKKIKQEGKKGKKKLTTDITFSNGIESKRNVVKEEVLEEPTKKIVLIGTKERPRPVARRNTSSNSSNSRSSSSSSTSSKTTSQSTAPKVSYNSASGSAIVATAKSLLGRPYRSGGTTPAGFDCSGFTSYVYRQHGISLPRSSSAQANYGKYVAKSQLQPGDIVAFTGHVGIYVGNGQMIHAPRAGRTVSYDSINNSYFKSRFVAGRRPY